MADDMVERGEIQPGPQAPIVETETSVSYLGVKVPKSQNRESPFVPKREQYADFINDADLALPMQRNIAVAWLQGEPILIEGGTSIGKTTAVRKMASELGYEVHYINLNGRTEVEDLMGKYISNRDKKSADDPEFTFAEGKVTSGLRREEGKIKVILIDEINGADPNVLLRIHEVLDALERDGEVVLTEDAAESIPVSKSNTKVVGLANPPGKGYFGREPLDPAQSRRWVYYKAPSELPEETFIKATEALFGLAPQTGQPDAGLYLPSREVALLPEQLAEIPGIKEIMVKYVEFHKGAKQLVKGRRVAADQPQLFTYDDRMEPRSVRNFVLSFYNGDITDTFQKALRFYYSNKVESAVDKAKLEELIALVEYSAPLQPNSPRRPLDVSPPAPITPDAPVLPDASGRRIKEREDWHVVFGKNVEVKPLPTIITPEITRNLERMGMELVYVPNLDLGSKDDIKPVTRRTPGRLGIGGSEEIVVAAEENYLKQLEERYPNWHRYEGMTDEQKEDHTISRNFQEWFWGQVKTGAIDFPNLPGQWMAVEKMPKPSYGEKYDDSPITEKLGFEDRFNSSWDDAHGAIEREKAGLLTELGIRSGADIRMLEGIEWNLIANRKGWGETNTWEWTNTEYRDADGSRRVVAGRSDVGGVSRAAWSLPSIPNDDLGFRLAVVFEP